MEEESREEIMETMETSAETLGEDGGGEEKENETLMESEVFPTIRFLLIYPCFSTLARTSQPLVILLPMLHLKNRKTYQ